MHHFPQKKIITSKILTIVGWFFIQLSPSSASIPGRFIFTDEMGHGELPSLRLCNPILINKTQKNIFLSNFYIITLIISRGGYNFYCLAVFSVFLRSPFLLFRLASNSCEPNNARSCLFYVCNTFPSIIPLSSLQTERKRIQSSHFQLNIHQYICKFLFQNLCIKKFKERDAVPTRPFRKLFTVYIQRYFIPTTAYSSPTLTHIMLR